MINQLIIRDLVYKEEIKICEQFILKARII